MSILVLTLLCVYVGYNALGLYIKLFAIYNNIFLWRLVKPKTGFQQPKSGFNIPYTYLLIHYTL